MNILFIILALLIGFIVGAIVYSKYTKDLLVTVSDDFVNSGTRSEKQQRQDAVMKLKNEIAESKALYFKDGKVYLTLYLAPDSDA